MSDQTQQKTAVWFWIISGVAMVWNLMGVTAYLMQVGMSAEDLAALAEAERNLISNTPAWATGAFAVAVFGGTLGSAALLMRSALAIPLFVISLAGLALQFFHAFFLSEALTLLGPQALIMPCLVALVGVLLLWIAFISKKWGWLH